MMLNEVKLRGSVVLGDGGSADVSRYSERFDAE